METVRIGRVIRAIRLRRGWRQQDLADRAGVSQTLVARVERGGADRLTVAKLESIVEKLGARILLRIDWNAEAADRLLDSDHAALVDRVLGELKRWGWQAVPEVTFWVAGERGSIDVLAWHEPTKTLLVVEVKSVVPDIQGMLSSFDRKVRLADRIAAERGWRPGRIDCVLVIGDSRTARRRIAAHHATFDARLPDRNVEVRHFLANPAVDRPALRGLWFLPPRTAAGRRQRVVRR